MPPKIIFYKQDGDTSNFKDMIGTHIVSKEQFELLLQMGSFELSKDYTEVFTCSDICEMRITVPQQIISNPTTKKIVLDIYNSTFNPNSSSKQSHAYIVLDTFIKHTIDYAKSMLDRDNGKIFQDQLARWNYGNVEISIYNIIVKIETKVSEKYRQPKDSLITASDKFMEEHGSFPDWSSWEFDDKNATDLEIDIIGIGAIVSD